MPNKADWSEQCLKDCEKFVGLRLMRDEDSLNQANHDFGRLVKGDCSGVAIPHNIAQLKLLVEYANRHHLALTPRGKGLSEGGQSIAGFKSLSVILTNLNNIEAPDLNNMTITCETGANWGEIKKACLSDGVIPEVTMANDDITLGGVLAVGGIASNSHIYGPVVSTVESLEVLTGNGKHVKCNWQKDKKLFHSSLSNLGYSSITTKATLRLRRFKKYTRSWTLLFDSLDACIDAEVNLKCNRICDHIETFTIPCIPGTRFNKGKREPYAHWVYALHLGCEYDTPQSPPTGENFLPYINFWQCSDISDTETVEFYERYQIRFKQMHQTGDWNRPHPWIDCFISASSLSKVLPEILNILPPQVASCRFQPINDRSLPRLFMRPPTNHLFALAILPMGVDEHMSETILSKLKYINSMLLAVGSKRYLSGWLADFDRDEYWSHHYGDEFEFREAMKKLHDPNKVLTSWALSPEAEACLESA